MGLTAMFFNAKPEIFERAKFLRENMTEAEKLLWNELRKKSLGVRFKSQHPAGNFILDFYCHPLKLAIELDGNIHKGRMEYDQSRTEELEKFGIRIVRFKNEQLQHMEVMMEQIRSLIIERK